MTEENNQTETSEFASWDLEDNSWAVGIALILAGGLFMLDSFNILDINFTNWWAIFILIPGLNMAVNGWRHYQETHSRRSRNRGFWGLVLILLAFSLFFNVAWSLIFPVVLIGCGIYLLVLR